MRKKVYIVFLISMLVTLTSVVNVTYTYDSAGNRIKKEIPLNTISEEAQSTISASVDTQKSVGQIQIKSGISPNGAKTYQIPIDVYPVTKHPEMLRKSHWNELKK